MLLIADWIRTEEIPEYVPLGAVAVPTMIRPGTAVLLIESDGLVIFAEGTPVMVLAESRLNVLVLKVI